MYYFSCKENLYLSIIKSPPVYSEDLFVAYFSNYQYAIADFCKKRNLQTAQFDKKSISFKRYIF